MRSKKVIYGNYSEAKHQAELQMLQLKSFTLDIDRFWENGSLSAAYISHFWENYIQPNQHMARADIRDSVRYITAELIGNAVQYSAEPDFLVKINLSLEEPEFRFFVTNKIKTGSAEAYQRFIENLLASDPEKLYIDQMEKNAVDDSWRSSIGFLTIMLDYGGSLAWKFETDEGTKLLTATTMVRMPIAKNLLK